MALVTTWRASVSFGDSRKKLADVSVRISEGDGKAWINAVDQAARDATDVGDFFAATAGLSSGTPFTKAVTMEQEDENAVFPTADLNIYNFDKLGVGFKALLDNYNMTIPARDDSAYTVSEDGVTVILTGAGATAEVTAFIAAFNGLVLGKNGGTGTVITMQVVS